MNPFLFSARFSVLSLFTCKPETSVVILLPPPLQGDISKFNSSRLCIYSASKASHHLKPDNPHRLTMRESSIMTQ